MSNTDASTKILGFEYQKMVALIKCLEAKNDVIIHLECFGDISDGTESVETKHSINDNKELYDTHEDFWKTLYNIIDNEDDFKSYTSFILHTTAKIREKSIFDGWNSLTDSQKESRIKSVKPTGTISSYINKVNSSSSDDLKSVLKRFKIEDNQKNARDYYKDVLITHPQITTPVPQSHIEPFVCLLLGYISEKLITSSDYIWKIDKNEFKIDFQRFLKNYLIDDLIFPNIKVDPDTISDKGYRFIAELRNIGYETKIANALNDYFRANFNRIDILMKNRSLAESLDDYDDEILESLNDTKLTFENRLSSLLLPNYKKESRLFYDHYQENISLKKDLKGVKTDTIKNYYPKGRTHHMIEESESFSWKLNKPK
ncbi:hypothetical protein BB050_02856 [Flavobacterium anhuiense]|uniref:Uncharacterized protein n=1 Tax=Flavobacterium anhuiense TaxID=459526 RepID=A0AAC9GIV9_9FLAO|nr:hypothetical protein [Flavobacterium anhuiense]AOC95950.1 hypothetical protein BB050_02856 [Flavobacterium anhuiense]